MYYIGWSPAKSVPTKNAIGLAVSEDGGLTFKRMFDGPVIGHTANEPFYIGAVYVINRDNLWMIWYTCGTKWKEVQGRPEILYHIKYAESRDGINWDRPGISCILPRDEYEVTARPCVLMENGKYKMWYSYRNIINFRTNKMNSYRIGYAESLDGKKWKRMDEKAGISVSEYGWDANMIAYPALYRYMDKLYMVYNGNGFGASGFGYAVLQPGE